MFPPHRNKRRRNAPLRSNKAITKAIDIVGMDAAITTTAAIIAKPLWFASLSYLHPGFQTPLPR